MTKTNDTTSSELEGFPFDVTGQYRIPVGSCRTAVDADHEYLRFHYTHQATLARHDQGLGTVQLAFTQALLACDAADEIRRQAVLEARMDGISWEEIAAAMGMDVWGARYLFDAHVCCHHD